MQNEGQGQSLKPVRLKDLVEYMGLEMVYQSRDYEQVLLSEGESNRPGLQLAGYLEHFPWTRIQIIGRVEYHYYTQLDPKIRVDRFRGIFSYPIPAVIYSYSQPITEDILELAAEYNKTVLRTPLPTTKFIASLNQALEILMAEEIQIHGGLLDIFGTGVLIRGKSSVGKSETGLDLVIRGHRLVADDVVNIKKIDNRLIGSCPQNIRYFMEIRGLGILDIRRLYGMGSVKPESSVDIVVNLEAWDENREYDRLGLDEDHTEILGVRLPQVLIPVKPGRSVAMIIEVAVRNHRQRMMGYNAAAELNKRLIEEADRAQAMREKQEGRKENEDSLGGHFTG